MTGLWKYCEEFVKNRKTGRSKISGLKIKARQKDRRTLKGSYEKDFTKVIIGIFCDGNMTGLWKSCEGHLDVRKSDIKNRSLIIRGSFVFLLSLLYRKVAGIYLFDFSWLIWYKSAFEIKGSVIHWIWFYRDFKNF